MAKKKTVRRKPDPPQSPTRKIDAPLRQYLLDVGTPPAGIAQRVAELSDEAFEHLQALAAKHTPLEKKPAGVVDRSAEQPQPPAEQTEPPRE